MTILKTRNTTESAEARLALTMKILDVTHGQPTSIILGAIGVITSAIFMRLGDGEDAVDAFAETIKIAIRDTKALMSSGEN